MQVNDLIFKEFIKRGYSLEGKTRVWNIADSKLWYLTPQQAQAYLDLEGSKDYNKAMFNTEIEMLKVFMKDISKEVINGDALNIIDIGCGDGKKAVPVINHLYDRVKVRYCPIDISGYMVQKAIEKIKKLNKGEVVEFKWNISDFDNLENVSSLLRDSEHRQNLFLFLGSTVSNFDFHEVMYEIAEAMDKGSDYLLMGVALTSAKVEDLVKSYYSPLVDNFLSKVLTEIGIRKEDIEMGVRYKNSRVEIYYTIKKDIKLTFGDQAIYFLKGDNVLVAISYRFNEKDLKKSMKMYFRDVTFYTNSDDSWALMLCKK